MLPNKMPKHRVGEVIKVNGGHYRVTAGNCIACDFDSYEGGCELRLEDNTASCSDIIGYDTHLVEVDLVEELIQKVKEAEDAKHRIGTIIKLKGTHYKVIRAAEASSPCESCECAKGSGDCDLDIGSTCKELIGEWTCLQAVDPVELAIHQVKEAEDGKKEGMD